MPAFKTLDDLSDIAGKRVLVRVDLNVPVTDGKVSDTTRIERVAPTILELSQKGAKVILLAHFGRPKGPDTKNSLKQVVPALAHALGSPVTFVDDCIGDDVARAVAAAKNGDVLLLENTRFHAGDEKNDPAFVKALATWMKDQADIKKVYLLGPERDLPLFDGLDVQVVSKEEADCVVCTGFFDDETEVPEDYRDMLSRFVAKGVPFICANPDLVVERGHRIIPCAGAVAAYYVTLGGATRIAGKPHKPIYEATMAAAREARGVEIDRSKVLAIGDGMPTDVRGAIDAGFDLLYISAGIHAEEYMPGGQTDEVALAAFLTRENAAPKFWMPRLRDPLPGSLKGGVIAIGNFDG
eukprot:gene33297-44571_t